MERCRKIKEEQRGFLQDSGPGVGTKG